MYLLSLISVLMMVSINVHAEENCYKIVTRSKALNIRATPNGKVCGSKDKGESLFAAGSCRDGWCPVSFKRGACDGTGWVKRSSRSGYPYIESCGDDPENIMEMPDEAVTDFQDKGNCYRVTTNRKLNIRNAPNGKVCRAVKPGTILTPKGSCEGNWCPVVFSRGSRCKKSGVGYVFRGKWGRDFITPCSVEVSSETTRADAGVSTSRPSERVEESSGDDELGSGQAETTQPSRPVRTESPSNSFSSSLPFRSRCTSSNCRKAARRGYNINSYNGCEGSLTIGRSNGRCDSTVYMNEALKTALRDNLSSCVKSTARSLGLGNVSNIHINSYGCFNYRLKRNGRTLSEHGKGSAIDIAGLELTFSNGRKRTISMHKNNYRRDGEFYDRFYRCWNDIGGSCSCGLRHNAGSRSTRRLHRDHMHLTHNCRRGRSC